MLTVRSLILQVEALAQLVAGTPDIETVATFDPITGIVRGVSVATAPSASPSHFRRPRGGLFVRVPSETARATTSYTRQALRNAGQTGLVQPG